MGKLTDRINLWTRQHKYIASVVAYVLELGQVVIISLAIVLPIRYFLIQPFYVKGASMEPNFHDNEYLLTDKVSYRFGEPERGDVVVFKAPPTYKDEFIKRVIGLPGEEVMVKEGGIFVNGQKINEPYLDSGVITKSGNVTSEGKALTVPEGSYFVLGDNRDHSLDSRSIGFINKSDITGRAWVIYWPLDKAGNIPQPVYAY